GQQFLAHAEVEVGAQRARGGVYTGGGEAALVQAGQVGADVGGGHGAGGGDALGGAPALKGWDMVGVEVDGARREALHLAVQQEQLVGTVGEDWRLVGRNQWVYHTSLPYRWFGGTTTD